MRSCILAAVFLAPIVLFAQAPAPSKPLSPQEEQKRFKLAKGLSIELVACEPQIESPVFMAFDPAGKIWVVEMRDYPNGPGPGQKPEGRIRILDDKDGDGFFETSTIFADGLLYANGLLHWKDGAIVTAAPHIAWLRDTDGDGKMDTKEILFEGFATQNPQLRVSHPTLGLDGWIYVANGLRGGQIVSAKKSGEAPINLSGMDFKFDMITGKYEAISGQGQFGNTFDDWGNRFVCDNRHHLRHIVLENRYLKRNPLLAAPGVVEDVSELQDGPLFSGGKIYPLSKNWTTSNLHEGRFTAACGVHIYRGDLLPKPYQGAAFTCDPTGNLVHGETLEPHGATFKGQPLQKGVEFLASPDDWFRPVSLAGGPDGALYVVDMYRAVIEHPEFMPPELRNRPDLNLGKDKGRIWRIVPEGHKRTTKKETDPVKMLASDNAYWRVTGQRLLLEKGDFDGKIEGGPRTKIHQAWLLHRAGKLQESDLLTLFQETNARVREQAVVIGENYLDRWAKTVFALKALSGDPDARVRFQVALSLGNYTQATLEQELVLVPLAIIGGKDAADKWSRLAIESSLANRAGRYLQQYLRTPPLTPDREQFVQELAALVGSRQDAGEITELLETLRGVQNSNAYRIGKDSVFIANVSGFNGLARGLAQRGQNLDAYFTKTIPADSPNRKWWNFILERAAVIAVHDQVGSADRKNAISLFAHASWPASLKTLTPLVTEEPDQELRLAAIRSLAAHKEDEVSAVLMKNWRSYSPAIRREVTEAMMRQPSRIQFLLDEIEKKNVKPGDIDALRTKQLFNHTQPTLRLRALKLLRDNIPADRKLVLTRYQEALNLKGDASKGQAIFKKNCATCHKVAGIGLDVGPDISDTRTKTLDALLVDVLNPNAAIDNNYVNYLVTTKAGKSVTGILTAETSTSVTLKRAEGQNDVILRQEIDEIQSSGQSLMPEGLEKSITVPEMADLLSFLKNWRYLEAASPQR